MSKMAELQLDIEDLIEQGMTAKFISVKLNIPINWVFAAIDLRNELELQNQQEFMSYGDE